MDQKRGSIGLTEIFHFSLEALWDRKMRSLLTILMVLVGTGLVTSLTGMSAGMQAFMNAQLSTLAPNVVIVIPSPRPLTTGGPPPAPTMVMNDGTVRVLESIKGVRLAIPAYRGQVNVYSGSQTRSTMLMGIDQDQLPYVNPDISFEQGRWASHIDPVGIVFGHDVAYPPGQTNPFVRVGQIVSIEYTYQVGERSFTNRRTFVVTGILNEVGSEFRDQVVFVSRPAANALLSSAGKYSHAYVITDDVSINDEVEASITKTFGVSNIGVISPKDIAQRVETIQGGFRFFLTVIALVSLVVGAMGIVTTTFTSVMERTREIGILKAIGSSDVVVLLIFLFESAAIGLFGGVGGLVIGSFAANLLITQLPLQNIRTFKATAAVITPVDVALILGLALALSMAAGLYPARRASKMEPVVALQRV